MRALLDYPIRLTKIKPQRATRQNILTRRSARNARWATCVVLLRALDISRSLARSFARDPNRFVFIIFVLS